MQRYLILDYETRSDNDLKKCGSWEYSLKAQILCVSFRVVHVDGNKIDKSPVQSWSPFLSPVVPKTLVEAFTTNENIIFVAHNAGFEQVITANVLFRTFLKGNPPPPERWLCTATLAAAHALPRKLEEVCEVLDLAKKDMEGHRLMLKMGKPRRETLHDKRNWHNHKEDLLRLIEYCVKDVEAETDVFLALPQLNSFEKKVWELDQKINLRGVKVDRNLIIRAILMIEREKAHLNAEAVNLSNGAFRSTTQREKVLEWVRKQGTHLPNLQAKTVDDAIAADMVKGTAKRVLEIRRSISKTSLGKYPALSQRSASDSYVRGSFLYWGASTGRWSGSGVQPQNFPRQNLKDIPVLLDLMRRGDLPQIRLLYGDVMGAFSEALRGMIIAEDGDEFFCADYASIEVRVLFWIADHKDGLKAFRENRQMYREMAEKIYGRKFDKDEGPEREVGKRAILGAGFGMGAIKFAETCKAFGQEVTEDLAKKAIDTYRVAHAPVPKLWYNLENAAIQAVRYPGKKFSINHTSWFTQGEFLYCELPSGRRLAYHRPTISMKETPWGEKRPTLYHWSVHPKTRKYTNEGTYGGKLTENVVQATARDLEAAALIRIENAGYNVVLHTHDEILASRAKNEGNLKEYENLMATLPKWATGCPVKAKGWKDIRYRK